MAGDLSRPFGDVKGYQFWALFGVVIIFGARIAMASGVPLGPFTATLIENQQYAVVLTDILGTLMVVSAYATYRGFVAAANS